jgi:ADP-heptose:LPS heptosyltransferase
MADMDLVVTVDTSVAHLAGMMGVPTWVMLSACRDWHYGKSATRSPWYPTQRLFRQDQPHDWQGVFDRIGIALQPFFNAGSGVR